MISERGPGFRRARARPTRAGHRQAEPRDGAGCRGRRSSRASSLGGCRHGGAGGEGAGREAARGRECVCVGGGGRRARCPDRLPFSSQVAPVAVAVVVVAVSAVLLLLLRGTGRRASGPVTLRDPLAKYSLRLMDKEVTRRPGAPQPPPSSRRCGRAGRALGCPSAGAGGV